LLRFGRVLDWEVVIARLEEFLDTKRHPALLARDSVPRSSMHATSVVARARRSYSAKTAFRSKPGAPAGRGTVGLKTPARRARGCFGATPTQLQRRHHLATTVTQSIESVLENSVLGNIVVLRAGSLRSHPWAHFHA
jgi:hypothetical protein